MSRGPYQPPQYTKPIAELKCGDCQQTGCLRPLPHKLDPAQVRLHSTDPVLHTESTAR